MSIADVWPQCKYLRRYIDNARPVVLEGLHPLPYYESSVVETLVNGSLGLLTVSTGWRTLDEYYRPKLGDITVVTGVLGRQVRCEALARASLWVRVKASMYVSVRLCIYEFMWMHMLVEMFVNLQNAT